MHQPAVSGVNEPAGLISTGPFGVLNLACRSVIGETRPKTSKGNIQPQTRMFRVGFNRTASQYCAPIVCEPPAATVCCALWPEAQRIQPRTAADCIPGISITSTAFASLMNKIQQQFSVWRKITAFRIDAAPDPCARNEFVGRSIPSYDMVPLAGTPPENYGFARLCGEDDEEPRWRCDLHHCRESLRPQIAPSSFSAASSSSDRPSQPP